MGKSPPVNSPSVDLGAWPLRVAWFLLPLTSGPVFADALDDASRRVQLVASVALWAGWAGVLLATLIPRSVTLTLVRIVTPAAAVAVALAVADAAGCGILWRVGALLTALAALGAAFAPSIGHLFVNGSSYGDEERFPLRIPGPLLLGPVELVWLVMVVGAVSGPLLLALGQWIVGIVALVIGAAVVGWGSRVLHALAQRWVVLVPAGLVLHDPLALSDPVLLRRIHVVAFGPATAETEALDLTRGALGLALEVRLDDATALGVGPTPRGPEVETVEAERVLITPTRPGALLAAARARRLGSAP
jgi:hypothetical protein